MAAIIKWCPQLTARGRKKESANAKLLKQCHKVVVRPQVTAVDLIRSLEVLPRAGLNTPPSITSPRASKFARNFRMAGAPKSMPTVQPDHIRARTLLHAFMRAFFAVLQDTVPTPVLRRAVRQTNARGRKVTMAKAAKAMAKVATATEKVANVDELLRRAPLHAVHPPVNRIQFARSGDSRTRASPEAHRAN